MVLKPILFASLMAAATFSAAGAATLTPDKYVAVMRHGVRPQTNSEDLLHYSTQAWPVWDTADGMLTAHGAQAAGKLGAWEVSMLRDKGLVPQSGCPAPGDVFGWANGSVKRTIDTGNTVLSAMFPGCGLSVGFNKTADVDVLYAASDAALGAIDVETAKAAILDAAGGSFDTMKAKAQPLLKELDAVLGCETSACSMVERPWTMEVKEPKNGKPASVSVKGPLTEAAAVAQVFLLQYANDFPMNEVAFGKLDGAQDIIRLSALRQMKYDISNRVPYVARRDASNFLNQILLAVAKDPSDATVSDGPPNARFLLFMASDTQQAEVAAMLGLHWHLPPYVDDETPPTGALSFERLHDASGRAYVRLGFTAPTLDQIRNASVIDAASPPVQASVSIPGCETETVEGACPLDRFLTIARASLDMSAVGEQSYR
ncbi:histidine-type phosphatase [Rhizobium sp. FY34]|uniref:histidine-type phosphatase n=1 Tax=Rhizobium sp. FY34 TaxID=2562309 RepID=UPI00148552D3|nr:histidine-type phosphatase [Rhizobium sp. FY34]